MNITVVTNSFGYGGAEKMVFFLAEGLNSLGFNVSMINLNQSKTITRFPSEKIRYEIADIAYSGPIQTNYEYVKFTYKAAKKFKSDMLISFTDMANFCVPIAAKILNTPSIISERGDPKALYTNCSMYMKIKFWFMNQAFAAVFQTEGAKEIYYKKLKKRSVVIPNPIFLTDQSKIVTPSVRPSTVVTLSRLENNTQKRFDILIETFYLFHSKHPEYKLIIYGEGSCKELILRLAEKYNIRNSIVLKGRTSNALYDISKEGIFLTTSDYEGISNSLLEAMSVGLPVVSTDNTPGGARLLITDHENGLLAPMGDSKKISEALCEYAENKALAEKCGLEARNVLVRFSPEKTMNDWVAFINKVFNDYGHR